jgi:hypothetical protein
MSQARACWTIDVPHRKIFGAAPFDLGGAVFHCRAKLAFQSRKPVLYCGPTLIDQPLGWFAFHEIERRTELTGGNPDHPGAEALRELPGNVQPRLVGLAERHADHDSCIFHCSLRMPAWFDL